VLVDFIDGEELIRVVQLLVAEKKMASFVSPLYNAILNPKPKVARFTLIDLRLD